MKPYIATTLLLALTALPASARQKHEKQERPREREKDRCHHERRHRDSDGGFIFMHGFPMSPAPEAPVYIPETNPGPDQLSVNGTVYEIDGGNNVALVSKAPEPAPEPAQPHLTRQQYIDKMRHQAAQWRELASRARNCAKEARSPEDRQMWEDTAEYEEEQARRLDEQIEKQKEWGAQDWAREEAAHATSAPSVAMANPVPVAGTGLPPSTGTGTSTPTSTGTTLPTSNGADSPPSTGSRTPTTTGTGTTTPPNTGTGTPPNTGMGASTPPNTGAGTTGGGSNGGTPPSTPPTRESQGEWNGDMAAEVVTTAVGTQMTGSEGIGGVQAAGAALTVAYQQKQTDDRNVPRTDRTNREIRDTLDHGHYSELREEPRNVWVQTIINLLTGNW